MRPEPSGAKPPLAIMGGVFWFALGSLFTFVFASGAAVYLSSQAWGKDGSFQVLCVISLVATFLLCLGFGLGAAIWRRFQPRSRSAIFGCMSAGVFIGLVWLASAADADPARSWALVLLLPFIGGAASLFHGRSNG
jgi:hypothetical protein